jgi:hypothetical protein
MSERERRNEQAVTNNPSGDGDDSQDQQPGRERVDSLRQHATELLAAARTVIDDTLSGESEDYLNSVKQQGGQ